MSSTSTVETNTGRVINVDQVHPELPLVYDDVLGTWHPSLGVEGIPKSANYVWDTATLDWVVMTQPEAGGGTGGTVTVDNFPTGMATEVTLATVASAVSAHDAVAPDGGPGEMKSATRHAV